MTEPVAGRTRRGPSLTLRALWILAGTLPMGLGFAAAPTRRGASAALRVAPQPLDGSPEDHGADRGHQQQERRDFLSRAGGLALSTVLIGGGAPSLVPSAVSAADEPVAAPAPDRRLTVVLTGANSGIGFEACRRLRDQGHRVVLACRSQAKAEAAVARLLSEGGTDEATARRRAELLPAECDLASLASVRRFVEGLPALLGEEKPRIDRLCLNAGLCRNVDATDCVRTADGFELTGT